MFKCTNLGSYLRQKKEELSHEFCAKRDRHYHFERVKRLYPILVKTAIVFSLAVTYKDCWKEAASLVRLNRRNLTIEMLDVIPN